jgi:large subunit ribosomal protein L4
MATKKSTITTKTSSDFSVFKVKVSEALLAQAIYVYQSNSHQDTSKVKTRGEIVASKRKIHKQKGTGRARHGALSAPIFVGGGVTHGPTGIQPNRKKLNTKMKQKALAGALSLLHAKNALDLFKSPTGKSIKTKQVLKLIPKDLEDKPFTLVQHQATPSLLKAFSNIQSIRIIPVDQLNAFHVLQSQKILFTPEALDFIKTKLKSYL